LSIKDVPADRFAAALRKHRIPVLARIEDDAVVLDCRCLFDDDLPEVAAAIDAAMEGCRG
jgi:seryl-tRNA(Sec) selenium transferase